MKFDKRKKIGRRRGIYLSDNMKKTIIAVAGAILFFAILWVSTLNYISKNEGIYSEYLAQAIPLYSTFNPKEEDVLKENFSLAALHLLLGINITEPTSMIKAQIPVFNQVDYVQVVNPEEPPFDDPSLEEPLDPDISKVSDDISLEGKNILIYHSHTTEAFVPTSGIPHTEDFEETIVKVGEHLASALESEGANVIHDKTHHSKRPYSDSYKRSRETVRKHLESDVEFDLIIDLHRDGVGTSSDIGRPVTTTEINGKETGRLMFVIGQRHDGWRNNYSLAQMMFNVGETLYPGLTRETALKTSGNYNQDLNEKMVLIEIGGHWNTLEEAINAVNPLTEIIKHSISQE